MPLRFFKLTILLPALAAITSGGISAQSETARTGQGEPLAVKGIINLRGYDLEAGGPFMLAGEWEFYWDTAVTPENYKTITGGTPDLYTEVPSYWDDLGEINPEITPRGVATYSLRILTDPACETGTLALKFLSITPNADIFIDSRRIARIGEVNPEESLSKSGNRIFIYPLSRCGDSFNLTISISNYHNVNGGLNRPIHIGSYKDILKTRELMLAIDAIFLGGLLLMGLYQFTLFFLDRKRRAPLFMAILCFLAFFFSGFKNEMVLLSIFPGWGGEIRTRFIYLSLALSAPIFTLYPYNIYPKLFRKQFNWILVIISFVFSTIIVFTSKSFYTRFLLPLEITVFVSAVYTIYMLFSGYAKTRDRRILYYLSGLGFLLASIVFSVVDNEISAVFQPAAGVFFIFILYQAFLQAYIFSSAFTEIDNLSSQKSKLEKRNAELFSLSYIDSLTETCNRRLMDDFLSSNWRVNAFSERSVGMILIDIDDFKYYNEFYGHRQGDVCLVKVCDLLRNTLTELGQNTLARYGGEEFAVIVSDMDEMTMFRTAEKLRMAVEAGGIEHRASPTSNVVTISIGYANLIPSRDMEPESLIDAADKALLCAKKNGRNRTEFHGEKTEVVSWEPKLV